MPAGAAGSLIDGSISLWDPLPNSRVFAGAARLTPPAPLFFWFFGEFRGLNCHIPYPNGR
jgi:hypothetical protein